MTVRHKTETGEVECRNCDFEGETEVTVDTWAGVAAFTCPECGETQEA